jgi:hypothetical protein
MSESAPARKPKGRSPAYPSINLQTAIQRARQLHDRERQYLTPVSTIVAHWGYSSLNGPALGAIAALKKYGLLDEEGAGEDRKAKLSQLADVILMNPDEAKQKEAIQEAALRPAIHQEMWEKYHNDLPSERNLLWELTRDRGFTERGAGEFIRVYRATIAFAQLEDDNGASEPEATQAPLVFQDDRDDDNEDRRPERPSTRERRGAADTAKSYNIPLIDNGAIVVEGQFPVTERDWNQFIAVLTAMKPGLVATLPDDSTDA